MPETDKQFSPFVQVNQSGSDNQTTVPASPPAINNDLVSKEQSTLEGKARNRWRTHVIKMIAILFLIATIGVFYFVYFIKIPKSQAGDYFIQTDADFKNFKTDLAGLNKGTDSAFNDFSSSFEISKGIYFDISQSIDFVEALADAKKDFDSVKSIQTRISDAKKNKAKFRVGGDVGELNKHYSEYLDKQEDGMNKLYMYESFRVDMLNAMGGEYNLELNKLLSIYNLGSPRSERAAYVENLSGLADEAVQRLKALSDVPEDNKEFYVLALETQEDMAVTLKDMLNDLRGDSLEGDTAAVSKLTEFGKRQLERNTKIREETVSVAQKSQTGKIFKEAIESEVKTQSEFDELRQKYGGAAQPSGNQ